MKMKKAVLLGPGQVEVQSVAIPTAPAGGVVVKVASCAVCGTDVETYLHGQRHSQLPTDLGHELTGTVTEVGTGENIFSVGDRVALNQSIPCGTCEDCEDGYENLCDHTTRIGGGFGEYVAIPELAIVKGNLLKIDDSLSFRDGVHAEALAAVVNCNELLDINLRDTVLVIGAGPVGFLHAQLAKVSGAAKVIITDLNQERLDVAKELSRADVLINGSVENLEKRLKEETNGRGPSKVIVANSNGNAQEQGMRVVAKRGIVSMFGFTHKEWAHIKFDSNDCHYREFFVTGAFAYSRKQFRMALDLLASGAITVEAMNTHIMPIEQVVEAMDNMKAGQGMKTLVDFL